MFLGSPTCLRFTYSSRQSETLKYLYLLFTDSSVLPLNGESTVQMMGCSSYSTTEYVFNTEVRLLHAPFAFTYSDFG